jgi:hypothetical protein
MARLTDFHHQLYPWESSTVTTAKLTALVNRGLLRPRTSARELLVPGNEVEPRPPTRYMVSFLAYHVRGFAMPAHKFLREILHHFDLELHALAPNSLQLIANFIAICEGYLGIDPDFELFKYLFKAAVSFRESRRVAPYGFCSLQLRRTRSLEYPHVTLRDSNKDWHRGWFYLKNHEGPGRLPEYAASRQVPHKDSDSWSWGPPSLNQKRLEDHLRCLARLKDAHGLTRVGVMDTYFRLGIAPLMERLLRIFEMFADRSAEELRAVLAAPGMPYPSDEEVMARFVELMHRSERPALPVQRPSMRPHPDAPSLVSSSCRTLFDSSWI